MFNHLFGCSNEIIYAPVSDALQIEPIPKNVKHLVKPKETFYSIAWRYGLDYRELAKWNHKKAPYTLHKNEVLMLKRKHIPSNNVKYRFAAALTPQDKPKERLWQWPAHGKVIKFSQFKTKGIEIIGHLGEPIFAASNGKVVYCNNGLRGYGNLIIIKHNHSYLTAYAHALKVLVKEGDLVTAGQEIAQMGMIDSGKALLYFEIRYNGKPVNPLSYLNHT